MEETGPSKKVLTLLLLWKVSRAQHYPVAASTFRADGSQKIRRRRRPEVVSSLQWNSGVWKVHLTHVLFCASDANWLSKISPKDFEELAGTGAWQIRRLYSDEMNLHCLSASTPYIITSKSDSPPGLLLQNTL